MIRQWILLRGLGRDKRHWGEFVSQFQQAFIHDKVTALDTCGNGDFVGLKSPLSIEQYTEHCRQQLETSSVEVHLVALSLGGMIALDWAHRYPQEVKSLTLINSSAANLTPWNRRIKFWALAKLTIRTISQSTPESAEKSILEMTSNLPLQQQILACWTKYRCSHKTYLLNLIRQLIAASRFEAKQLPKLAPLVLTSKTDRLVNTIASKDLHRFLGGHIVEHLSAGHDLPLDDCVWVIKQIIKHIDMSQSCHQTVKY